MFVLSKDQLYNEILSRIV